MIKIRFGIWFSPPLVCSYVVYYWYIYFHRIYEIDRSKIYTIWKINANIAEGYPIPIDYEPQVLGAFAYLTNLTSITIPSSVKHIGKYAFYKTGLQHVTLASDCTYYSTSFPPESQCQVDGGICLY